MCVPPREPKLFALAGTGWYWTFLLLGIALFSIGLLASNCGW